MKMIPETITTFLTDLRKNNNREWFADNRQRYHDAKIAFEEAVAKLIEIIGVYDKEVLDLTPGDCVFRIYRDVRFSKDKTPYKTHFDAYIAKNRGRKSIYAGYYFHLFPGDSLFGGGIYAPIPEILNLLRKEIYNFPEEFKSIISSKNFKACYTELYEDKLLMIPKGFPKDFPDAELLRYRSFVVRHPLTNKEIHSDEMKNKFSLLVRTIYPFISFLNRAINLKEDVTGF